MFNLFCVSLFYVLDTFTVIFAKLCYIKQLQSTLPQLESPVTAIAFQPETNYLAVICSNNQVGVFSWSLCTGEEWSISCFDSDFFSTSSSELCQKLFILVTQTCVFVD